MQVGTFLRDDPTLSGKSLAHGDPRLETVHTVELRSGVDDSAPGVQDRDHRQRVAQPDLEVVGVVSGRDFDRPGAEFGIHVIVGDDDEWPVEEGVRQGATHQVAVALIVRVHRDSGVAEHRLDPGSGDHDVRFRVVQ